MLAETAATDYRHEAARELADDVETPTRFNADRRFLLAGRAILTVTSPKTGKHYTFRVSTKDGRDGRPVSFVGLLTGPNNEADYSYLGVLDHTTGEVRRTAKTSIADDAPGFVAVRWVLSHLMHARPIAADVQHAGRCGRCARTLTDPTSITLGIGPECRSKMGGF